MRVKELLKNENCVLFQTVKNAENEVSKDEDLVKKHGFVMVKVDDEILLC